MTRFTRRSFVGAAAAAAVASAVGESQAAAPSAPRNHVSTFCDILRVPDRAIAFTEDLHAIPLQCSQSAWNASGIEVRTVPAATELNIFLHAPALPLIRLHLRWNIAVDASVLILGDAWERSYGDLAWRTFVPERAMPWYFATQARDGIHGYGVKTAAGSLCFWQVDREGVSLWLDVSNGGMGVALGQRELHAATVVSRKGASAETPLESVTNFCRVLCPKPRLHNGPVFGSNDWYYAYGKNKGEWILRDAELISALSPANGPRPFVVIDDGWEGNSSFPDMAQMADDIRKRHARPGIWVRPLIAKKSAAANLLLPASRFGTRTSRAQDLAYDPTIPEALNAAMKKISDPTGWKYELIKHDYSTYDLLGQWGFEMGAQPTISGWHFSDRSKTNAEIILDFYTAIRKTAGDSPLILGCNTVGHLTRGPIRTAANRRRHQRTSLGAHPPHGRQHPRLSPAAAQHLLRAGCGLRRHHARHSLGTESRMARPDCAQRHRALYLARAGSNRRRAKGRHQGSFHDCVVRRVQRSRAGLAQRYRATGLGI